MPQFDAHMVAGGLAQWGRQLPKDAKLNTVCYEADLISKLTLRGGIERTSYHRSVYVGMDDVESDGRVPSGFGTVRLEDIRSQELLIGRVEWWEEDGRDLGTFYFEGGTGFWERARGRIDVLLEFCTKDRAGDLTCGDPVAVMGFLEGTGNFVIAD